MSGTGKEALLYEVAMDLPTYLKLKSLTQQKSAARKSYEKMIKEIDDEIDKITRRCDHINPDGTSAWKGGWMFSACEICYENDL